MRYKLKDNKNSITDSRVNQIANNNKYISDGNHTNNHNNSNNNHQYLQINRNTNNANINHNKSQ